MEVKHPNMMVLINFALGIEIVSEQQVAEVKEHLPQCEQCANGVQRMIEYRGFLRGKK